MSFSLSSGFKKAHYAKTPETVASLLSNTMTFTEVEIVDAGKLGAFAEGDFIKVHLNANDGIYAQCIAPCNANILTFATGTFTPEAAGSYSYIEKVGSGSFASIMQNGVIDIMGSSRPEDADASAGTAVLLARITKGGLGFSSGASLNGLNVIESGGVITRAVDPVTGVAEVWSGLGLVEGTAYWARWHGNTIVNGASTTAVRLDGDCNDNSAADVFIDERAIVTGKPITVNSVSLTLRAVNQ